MRVKLVDTLISLHDGSYELLAKFAPHATRYLGIGVQEGYCALQVAVGNPAIAMTLCDTWGNQHGGTGRGSFHHVESRLVAAGHHGSREYLTGESQIMIPGALTTDTFDLIYVDGSHEEAAALDDLKNCWPRCRGILLLHDVKMPPVMSALYRWLETVEDGSAYVTLAVGGHGTAIIGRLR